eukprot:350518-Prorocentrum_lima.AAC.1
MVVLFDRRAHQLLQAIAAPRTRSDATATLCQELSFTCASAVPRFVCRWTTVTKLLPRLVPSN